MLGNKTVNIGGYGGLADVVHALRETVEWRTHLGIVLPLLRQDYFKYGTARHEHFAEHQK
jgi:hypothetical protein